MKLLEGKYEKVAEINSSNLFIFAVFTLLLFIMPHFCAVVGCGHRSERDKFSYFRIPSQYGPNRKMDELRLKQRNQWINVLRREDLTDNKIKNARICSAHFISGK